MKEKYGDCTIVRGDSVTLMYGPHDFPGGPELYLRLKDPKASVKRAHEMIRRTLVDFFTQSSNTVKNRAETVKNRADNLIYVNFINYGNTELVYEARINDKDNRLAILINQPHTQLGVVRKEFDNLNFLSSMDTRFISIPFRYHPAYAFGHELYASAYYPSALCIIHDQVFGHGFYNPSPFYHFETFSSKMSHAVSAHMIAILVNYYDEKNGRGIAATQISGNDFILTRDFLTDDENSILRSIKLISARDTAKMSLDEYCRVLKKEFTWGTARDDPDVLNGKMVVNHRSSAPLRKEDIEQGIDLGMRLRSKRSAN